MNDETDVIVIGGGIAGAALTYALAQRRAGVLLLEKEQVAAAGASGATMGMALWIGLHGQADLRQAKAGLRRLASLEAELEAGLDFRLLPSLVLAPDEAGLNKLRQYARTLSDAGFALEIVDAAGISQLEPALGPHDFAGAIYAQQGHLDGRALTVAYVQAAQRLGAEVRRQTSVDGFDLHKGRITAVRAAGQRWIAGQVVLAAGAWTRQLGALLGLTLPIYYIHGEALATEPLPPLLNNMLMVASPTGHSALERQVAAALADSGDWETWAEPAEAQDVSMVQTGDGCVLLGQISRAAPQLDLPMRPQAIKRIRAAAVDLVPALAQAATQRRWIAPVPFTPDQRPRLGLVPAIENLYLCAGFKSALITAPTACETLADQILAAL